MKNIKIVGHKNPDTDSIVSAIAAQEFFTAALGKDAKAYRAGGINNETKFILDKVGVEIPELITPVDEDDSVALVDHNEMGQVFDGLNFSNVDYIIDHHKLSIVTEKPLFIRMAPLGSTSSIIAQLFFQEGIKPSEKIAKLLLAGILSDTLNLTSPTTTDEDRSLVEKINDVAKLNIEEFVSEMFQAKSSLDGISIQDIITVDYKAFEMGKLNVGIATWETTNPESVNAKKAEIMQALSLKKESDKMDRIFFMAVDILKTNCHLYIIGEEEKVLAEQIFGGSTQEDILFLPGVVSRKKQVVIPMTEELSK